MLIVCIHSKNGIEFYRVNLPIATNERAKTTEYTLPIMMMEPITERLSRFPKVFNTKSCAVSCVDAVGCRWNCFENNRETAEPIIVVVIFSTSC